MTRTQLVATAEHGQYASGPVLMGVIAVISIFTQADQGEPARIQLLIDPEETTGLIDFDGVGGILVEADCDLDTTEITTAVAAMLDMDPSELHIAVVDDDFGGDAA